jgi:hypothetical protein
MSERHQIVLVTNLCIVALTLLAWVTGRLSWQVATNIFVLWLLVPFGCEWSQPKGEPLYWWRAIVSMMAIGTATAVAGLLVAGWRFW